VFEIVRPEFDALSLLSLDSISFEGRELPDSFEGRKMMIHSRRVWTLFLMLFGLEGMLAGQTMIEYGLGAGRAGTSTAAGKGVSKAVGGLVDKLNKVLSTGQEATSTSESPSTSRGTGSARQGTGQRATLAPLGQAPVVPAKIYEDPTGIRAGMANEELVRRFGPPALEVTGASSGRTLTYSGKNGIVQLDLRDEKVSRISAMKSEQAAVVLPSGRD
jgi:hypothetical protein